MPDVTFTIADVNDQLSLAYAQAQGYKIKLRGVDGDALVQTPEDDLDYHLTNFACDCQDAIRRGGSYEGHCQHAIWVAQMRPCICGGAMLLGEFTTCFGEVVPRFECPECGDARDFNLVKAERRLRRSAAPDVEASRKTPVSQPATSW
jgi:hypothetical protein